MWSKPWHPTGSFSQATPSLEQRMRVARLVELFREVLRSELDLECVLRKALDLIHQHAGACNAIFCLPTGPDEYVMGGYMNRDVERSAAALLMPHLAEVAGPIIADAPGPIHLTNNAQIDRLLREDGAWLADMEVIGLPCRDGGELMACLLLFRDSREPFETDAVYAMGVLCAVLAEHVTRVMGIHHRLRLNG